MSNNDVEENRLRSLAIDYGDLARRLDKAELEEAKEIIQDAIDALATAVAEAEEALKDSEDPLEEKEEE